MTTALIIGKFLPPHRGHRYLAESARALADEVLVCLLSNSQEPISSEMRHRWLEEILPWATVVSTTADHPVDYDDDDVHDLWAGTIQETVGVRSIDVLVTSEPAYGDAIARRLGARHVLLDADRRPSPISASAIRADPTAHLDSVDPPVRRWLLSLDEASRSRLRAHVPLGPRRSASPAKEPLSRRPGGDAPSTNEGPRGGT